MKRVLSLLLAIVMVFGLMPMATFAAGEPTISFETTFADDMTVGATFTVTGSLANNPGMATMTLSLKWNEDAVKFTGFEAYEDGYPVSEVFEARGWSVETNHNEGIVIAARTANNSTNGTLFTANFEIIGSGELGIGLKDADRTEFEMVNAAMEVIEPVIDYSAISGLSVAAPEPEGPSIPAGAPFTAVTTDAGKAVAVEDCGVLAVDPWGGNPVEVPYYHITIPAGATEAYVQFDQPISAFMSQTAMDGTPEIGSAWACVNDYESGMAGLLFEDKGTYTNVIIPLEFNGDPWGGEDMKSTVKTADEDELYYAVGPQDAGANTIAVFSLEYDSEDGEDTYAITINQPTGGTVSAKNESGETVTKAAAGDFIFLANEPDEGYQFKHYLINGVEVTEAELGMANGFYTMPAEDVEVSAYFKPNWIPDSAKFIDMKTDTGATPVVTVVDGRYQVAVPYGTTRVDVIYPEGLITVDQFDYTHVTVDGFGLYNDAYQALTKNGKTTVGILMEKRASNGAPIILDLIVLGEKDDLRTVGVKPGDATETFSFTYQLEENQHYAILESGDGYYVLGDPIAADGYTFKVLLEEGYEKTSDYAVKVNGEIVSTETGEITLATVTEDLVITVVGVTKTLEQFTDISVTVDLTDYAGEIDGYIGYVGNDYNYTEVVLEAGKNNVLTVAAADCMFFEFGIYEIDSSITGYDVNGTVYPVPSSFSSYAFANGFTGYVNGTEISIDNDSQTPGQITVKPIFEEHTCTYSEEVIADKYLKSEATCQSGAVYYKSCTCGEFATTAETFVSGEAVDHVYVAGACKWCGAAEPVQTPGYRFATSADVSAENGGNAVVHVKITGHSDPTITTYNAYDLTLTFDTEKLEYVSCAGAVVTDGGEIKVEGNTIRIVGCGAAKEFGTEIAALTFKTLAEGAANVTIDKVQISDNDDAVNQDIPDATPKHDENDTTADETPDESVIVVPFSVTKPDFISGNETILHGETYTFSFTDTDNYTYSELKVTVGGTEVTPSEADGVYTIENVTGAIVITATQTAKSYAVTLPESAQGPEQATYGEKYTFTVTPDDGYAIASVKAFIGEKEIAVTVEDGKYVIAGGDITGAIKIVVEQTKIEVPETKYTKVTFEGITAEEIEDGLTQNPESGKPFTFKLNKIEGYNYVVKIGETELTANEDGTYTIAGELLVADGELTVVIVKTEIINVEVTQYIELDEQAMFLVTAKSAVADSQSVLKYGQDVMYTSEKYGAYSWLVISADGAESVKAAAETAITIAEAGVTAPAVAYGFDVNGTSKVDVNDAQLVYDMYNASYDAFTENLTVKKFLEADVDGSKNLGTQDVAAIINYIVNGNNA